jgi:hypothetical protein
MLQISTVFCTPYLAAQYQPFFGCGFGCLKMIIPNQEWYLLLHLLGALYPLWHFSPSRPYVENLSLDPRQVIVLYALLEEVSEFLVVSLI